MNTATPALTSSAARHGDLTGNVLPMAALDSKPTIDQGLSSLKMKIMINHVTPIKKRLAKYGVNMHDNPSFSVDYFLAGVDPSEETFSVEFARNGVPAGRKSLDLNRLLDVMDSRGATNFEGMKLAIKMRVKIPSKPMTPEAMMSGLSLTQETRPVDYYLTVMEHRGKFVFLEQSKDMPKGDNVLFLVEKSVHKHYVDGGINHDEKWENYFPGIILPAKKLEKKFPSLAVKGGAELIPLLSGRTVSYGQRSYGYSELADFIINHPNLCTEQWVGIINESGVYLIFKFENAVPVLKIEVDLPENCDLVTRKI